MNEPKFLFNESSMIKDFLEYNAEKYFNKAALITVDKKLTWKELDYTVDALIFQLVNKFPFLQESCSFPVIICNNKPDEFIICLLAMLKLGIPYIPIDTTDAKLKIKESVRDSNCRLILSGGKIINKLESLNLSFEIFNVSKIMENLVHDFNNCDNEVKLPKIKPNSVACILYTSGTTGGPKKFFKTHLNFVNRGLWHRKCYSSQKEENIGIFVNYRFVVFSLEITTSVIRGNTMVVYPVERGDVNTNFLIDFVSRNKITCFTMVPSLFINLFSNIELSEMKKLASLRFIIFTGENTKTYNLLVIKKHIPTIELFDQYGSTEGGTIISTELTTEKNNINKFSLVDNVKLYILDENLKPVLPSTIGNVFISGYGISRLNINNKNYYKNPFSKAGQKDEYLFETGDKGLKLSSGVVKIMGRGDEQQKLFGQIISLQKIEQALHEHENVKKAVVFLRENKNGVNKYLIAFCQIKNTGDLTEAALQTYLKKKLSAFEVPTRYIFLKNFPLLENGKINKKLLKTKIGFQNTETLPPVNPIEMQVYNIWKYILEYNVGVDSDFFLSGGNSFSAVLLVSRINSMLSSNLPISFVYNYRTIRLQAREIYKYSNSDKQRVFTFYKNNESDKVLILYPTITSGAEAYYELVQGLKQHFNIYCINHYFMLEPDRATNCSTEEYYEYYTALTEKIIKNNSYKNLYLGGWSLGGHIALQVEEKLQFNYNIDRVFLFDIIKKRVDKNLLNPVNAFYHYFKLLDKTWQEYEIFILSQEKIVMETKHKKRNVSIISFKCTDKNRNVLHAFSYKNISKYFKTYNIISDHMNMLTLESSVSKINKLILLEIGLK
jgi:acyl-coenzyme A synthetase/AMP-(fatty) acid ligase